jgi:hypothetical protein
MVKRNQNPFIAAAVAAILAAGAGVGTALAREQIHSGPDKLALGTPIVKRMLSLMDEEHGRVSQEDFMKFVQAEFDRLDKDKSGELDVKELTHRK